MLKFIIDGEPDDVVTQPGTGTFDNFVIVDAGTFDLENESDYTVIIEF